MSTPEPRLKRRKSAIGLVNKISKNLSGLFDDAPDDNKENSPTLDYSSGESEAGDGHIEYQNARTAQEKKILILEMWRVLYIRALGAKLATDYFKKRHKQVLDYGSTKNIQIDHSTRKKKYLLEKHPLVLL